jgi:hypothetical protein
VKTSEIMRSLPYFTVVSTGPLGLVNNSQPVNMIVKNASNTNTMLKNDFITFSINKGIECVISKIAIQM